MSHAYHNEDICQQFLPDAEKLTREYGRVSVALIQYRFRLGYHDAKRIADLIEQKSTECQP